MKSQSQLLNLNEFHRITPGTADLAGMALDIEIHAATASWSILKGAPVPANGTLEIVDECLGQGETLKAKVASNDAIDLHIMAGIIR